MFNFKKNNNIQQNQNSNPNLNIPAQTPIQSQTDNQVQDDQDQPLTSPPNLDDFDPPSPVFDLPQNSAPNLNFPQTPTTQPLTPSIQTQPQIPQPLTSPEISIQQPQTNIPDLDSQLKNLNNNSSSYNQEQQDGEDIMTDISSFQEDFNTKYDQLAEKVRQFLNKKIEEDKKTDTPKMQNLTPIPQQIPTFTPPSSINEEAPQMSQNLAQDEINQRQAQLNNDIKPSEQDENQNLESQDGNIEDLDQITQLQSIQQLNPIDSPANPTTLK